MSGPWGAEPEPEGVGPDGGQPQPEPPQTGEPDTARPYAPPAAPPQYAEGEPRIGDGDTDNDDD